MVGDVVGAGHRVVTLKELLMTLWVSLEVTLVQTPPSHSTLPLMWLSMAKAPVPI
ncbi:unnamed protein product [Chrysoparadoxa australica]